ncbi:MAG TPA: L,D-transpeptidase [Pyrinomonadaceae bacterium]|nr:L,D-transpeptidase [Pyrinomonadaceae bacterium]
MKSLKCIKIAAIALLVAFFLSGGTVSAQSFMSDIKRDSARSDKRTGGKIEKTALVAGDGDIKITLNVPAFQMTLWQNGKEVKSYPVGVGMKEFPIFIGMREATQIIWNPNWIPPSSDWVKDDKTVKPGEIIKASDKRNPLGKLKIPLGYSYLIHQAKGAGDLGSLVSHGCVRVLQADLYDLAEKIVAARNPAVSPEKIKNAKRTKNIVTAQLDTPIPVEITYDTQVVEAGRLHIYPDVYQHKKNTVQNLRAELESSGIDQSGLTDETLEKMLAQATAKKRFTVSAKSIEAGRALSDGRSISVLAQGGEQVKKTSNLRNRRKVSRKN